MYAEEDYENTWRMIQLANMERLEESNRIRMAKLIQQSKPRNVPPLVVRLAPLSQRVVRAAAIVLTLFLN